jgi:hypothetical protein
MQLQSPAAPGCHHRTYHEFCEDDGQHGSDSTCLISRAGHFTVWCLRL